MKKLIVKRLPLILATSLTMAACAGKMGETFNTPHNSYQLTEIEKLDQRQRANLFEAIITADLAEHQQDYQTATSHYLFAADLSKDLELIERTIETSQKASDPLGMEQAARIWLQIEPQNELAASYLLQAQLAQQNTGSAFATAKALLSREPETHRRFQFLEDNLLEQDPRLAFAIIRQLDAQMPDDPALKTGLASLIMNLSGGQNRQNKMLAQALVHADEALAIEADFVPAIRVKSHTLFQLREDDRARVFLSAKHNRFPESEEIAQMLGQLLYDLRDYQASIAHYTDWIGNHPRDLESRFYLAASHYSIDDNEESLEHFKILLEADYQSNTVAFFCGDAAAKLGQIDLTIECLQRVRGGKFFVPARVQLARLFSENKAFDTALQVLQPDGYAGIEPLEFSEREKLLSAEIDLLAKHFSVEKAKQRLDTALADTPESPIMLLKKIQLYELQSKPEELMKLLEKTRTLIPAGKKYDNFILASAALLNNNGFTQRAIDWLTKALTDKPDDKDILYTRAIYREPLGEYKLMIDEFKHLLSLYPDDPNIQNALGYTLVDRNQELEYAKNLIDQAYQGLPQNSAVVDSKGWLAYRLGDLAEAIQYLTMAFKMSPSAEVAAHLGEVLWKDNKKEMAKKVWQQGLALDADNVLLSDTLKRFNVSL